MFIRLNSYKSKHESVVNMNHVVVMRNIESICATELIDINKTVIARVTQTADEIHDMVRNRKREERNEWCKAFIKCQVRKPNNTYY